MRVVNAGNGMLALLLLTCLNAERPATATSKGKAKGRIEMILASGGLPKNVQDCLDRSERRARSATGTTKANRRNLNDAKADVNEARRNLKAAIAKVSKLEKQAKAKRYTTRLADIERLTETVTQFWSDFSGVKTTLFDPNKQMTVNQLRNGMKTSLNSYIALAKATDAIQSDDIREDVRKNVLLVAGSKGSAILTQMSRRCRAGVVGIHNRKEVAGNRTLFQEGLFGGLGDGSDEFNTEDGKTTVWDDKDWYQKKDGKARLYTEAYDKNDRTKCLNILQKIKAEALSRAEKDKEQNDESEDDSDVSEDYSDSDSEW